MSLEIVTLGYAVSMPGGEETCEVIGSNPDETAKIKKLQGLLGVAQDGIAGIETLVAINTFLATIYTCADLASNLDAILDEVEFEKLSREAMAEPSVPPRKLIARPSIKNTAVQTAKDTQQSSAQQSDTQRPSASTSTFWLIGGSIIAGTTLLWLSNRKK